MSSTVYLNWDRDTKGVPRDEWLDFCVEQSLIYETRQIGRNGFYKPLALDQRVSVIYGDANYDELPRLPNGLLDIYVARPPEVAHIIYVSAAYGASSVELDAVAFLGLAIWQRWGGTMAADPEVRRVIAAHVMFA